MYVVGRVALEGVSRELQSEWAREGASDMLGEVLFLRRQWQGMHSNNSPTLPFLCKCCVCGVHVRACVHSRGVLSFVEQR